MPPSAASSPAGTTTRRNPTSGAYGKYQIMPSNWPSWARQYLGNANARQTPANQEKVASGKMTSLYRWLGSWKRVAYWWLTGSSRTTGWSSYAKRYVAKVMRYYRAAGGKGRPRRRPPAGSPANAPRRSTYSGTWRSARHRGLRRRSRRLREVGRGAGDVLLRRPKGRVERSDGPDAWQGQGLHRREVRQDREHEPRLVRRSRDLFQASWKSAGEHSLKIVVVGTKGHPMVAIDDFVVLKK